MKWIERLFGRGVRRAYTQDAQGKRKAVDQSPRPLRPLRLVVVAIPESADTEGPRAHFMIFHIWWGDTTGLNPLAVSRDRPADALS